MNINDIEIIMETRIFRNWLNEHDNQIRADAIDEFVNKCIEYEDLTFANEHIERIKMIAEQLKEQK